MGFSCGIVGLPNVGKSTLFNALTATAQAEIANYPFSTIEPNVGRVAVPDARLAVLAQLAASKQIVPTFLDFVDIAGLVRGASAGEGLGNQFLGHIRDVEAICHVLRCFAGGDVTHVEGSVDPVRDAEIIETELMLADLESLERRWETAVKRARGGDRAGLAQQALIEPALAALRDGRPARSVIVPKGQARDFRLLHLLTAKPVFYVCNVDEASVAGNDFTRRVAERAAAAGAGCVIVSASIEAELAELPDAADRAAFLADLGLAETGLDRVIRAGYALLGLITFLTAGPKTTQAWTVARGATARDAAGAIHTDFARGFIAAETIAYADYAAHGSEQAARDAGKMRREGRDYIVQDGDVILFRFNV